MPKIERKTQKIFAKDGGQNGQFGSAQALSPNTSDDLDVLQSLAAYLQGWQDATISGDKRPPLEEENALHYIETSQIAYLLQEGIAEYDAGTKYYENSIVKETGTVKLYKSLTDNNEGNPLTDVVNWKLLIDLDTIGIIGSLGTAAFENIGSLDGEIPVIGSGDKLDNSILNNSSEILEGINRLSTQTEANNENEDTTTLTPEKLHNAILGYDLLQTQVASGSVAIEFINLPLSDYSDFKLVCSGVTPSNNMVNLNIRFSNDNGGVWQNTGYRYALSGRHTGGGNASDDDNIDGQIVLNDNGGGNQVGNQAQSVYNSSIDIYGLDSSLKNKHISYQASYDANTAGRSVIISGNGVFFLNTQPVNGIQIFFSAGTFDGTFKLYGIK